MGLQATSSHIKNIYRLTIGRDITIEGTLDELAYRMDTDKKYLMQKATPSYQNRMKKQRFKLELIEQAEKGNVYQLFDKYHNWMGTGTINELAEETGYTYAYLFTFIEGSKTLEKYMNARKSKNAKPPFTLVRVEE